MAISGAEQERSESGLLRRLDSAVGTLLTESQQVLFLRGVPALEETTSTIDAMVGGRVGHTPVAEQRFGIRAAMHGRIVRLEKQSVQPVAREVTTPVLTQETVRLIPRIAFVLSVHADTMTSLSEVAREIVLKKVKSMLEHICEQAKTISKNQVAETKLVFLIALDKLTGSESRKVELEIRGDVREMDELEIDGILQEFKLQYEKIQVEVLKPEINMQMSGIVDQTIANSTVNPVVQGLLGSLPEITLTSLKQDDWEYLAGTVTVSIARNEADEGVHTLIGSAQKKAKT